MQGQVQQNWLYNCTRLENCFAMCHLLLYQILERNKNVASSLCLDPLSLRCASFADTLQAAY